MKSIKDESEYMLRAFSKHKNHQDIHPAVHGSLVLKNESNIQSQQGLAFSDDGTNSGTETSNDSESSKTSDGYYASDKSQESDGFKLDAEIISSENLGVDPSRFLKKVIFEDVYNQSQRLKKMHEQYSDAVKKKFPYTESIKNSNQDLMVEEKTREQYQDYGRRTHLKHFSTPGNQNDQDYSITAEVTKFNDPRSILSNRGSEPLFAGKSPAKQIS